MIGRIRLWGTALAAVMAVLALSSCYVPDQFMAEVRIGRSGDYAMRYQGDLVWAPLYGDVLADKLPAEQQAAKIAAVQEDLARDANFKSIESKGRGWFSVRYEREGSLGATDLVTFVRRNATIMSLRARRDGTVAVRAAQLKPGQQQELLRLGLGMKGEFRVITDAPVVEHNATEIRNHAGYPVYIWRIDNPMSPTPKLVLKREGAQPS